MDARYGIGPRQDVRTERPFVGLPEAIAKWQWMISATVKLSAKPKALLWKEQSQSVRIRTRRTKCLRLDVSAVLQIVGTGCV